MNKNKQFFSLTCVSQVFALGMKITNKICHKTWKLFLMEKSCPKDIYWVERATISPSVTSSTANSPFFQLLPMSPCLLIYVTWTTDYRPFCSRARLLQAVWYSSTWHTHFSWYLFLHVWPFVCYSCLALGEYNVFSIVLLNWSLYV